MERRRLLQLGLAGSVALLAGGGLASLRTPGMDAEGRLTPAGRLAMGAVARAVLDGSLAEDGIALDRHLDGFDTAVANFPAVVRAELAQLLGLLVHPGGRVLLLGTSTALHELPRVRVQELLQALRSSRIALRQQAYFALRDLNAAAFYAEPAHWAAIGYPGPNAL